VPPLRERPDDIPLLVAHFIRKFTERYGKAITHVPEDLIEALQLQAWPGNVRELENVIERAMILARDGVLRAPAAERRQQQCEVPPRLTLADLTRDHILATLREAHWVVGGSKGAAARLGLCRTTLIAKMQRLGISREPSSVLPEARRPSARERHASR
jgi:formate hydrogenlyase transcriptional activator